MWKEFRWFVAAIECTFFIFVFIFFISHFFNCFSFVIEAGNGGRWGRGRGHVGSQKFLNFRNSIFQDLNISGTLEISTENARTSTWYPRFCIEKYRKFGEISGTKPRADEIYDYMKEQVRFEFLIQNSSFSMQNPSFLIQCSRGLSWKPQSRHRVSLFLLFCCCFDFYSIFRLIFAEKWRIRWLARTSRCDF